MPNIIIENNEYEKTSSIPYITNSLSIDAVEEKYKAILFFNHNRIDSNELVFTNNKPTSMAIAGDLNNALYIEVGAENSNSMESHQLYNQYYTLLKASDQFINRKIRVRFDGVQGKDEMLVGTQVFWYVPTQATMLRVDDTKLKREGFSLVENNGSDDAKYYRSGYVCYYRNIAGIDTNDTIMPIDADTYFWYQVAPIYNPTLTNNIIICKVIKDNQEYHTEKLFTFSTYGNNGTDYTVSIVPTGNQSAVVENNDLQLQAIFSDYGGKELEAPSYEWSWQGPSYFKQIVSNEHPETLKVTFGENVPSNFCLYNIAKVSIPWDKINATVGANETLNLVGLRAIPYAASVDYYIQGASTIIYNNLGVNPQYENMPYKIFDAANDGAEIIDVTWELMHYTEDGEEYSPTAKDFVPSIYTNKSGTEYYLKPSTMYVVDQLIYSVAVCKQGDIILYAQPIYIGQNRYSSPMLNSWDESLQIDETNNTVMSAMMGAGYKDNLNRFNGVLMGNVGPKAQIDSIINAGIYGFNEGAQSFAWKVDGTGFIGKSGKGRIEFDGNNGVIRSPGWEKVNNTWIYNFSEEENAPKGGTILDLADGQLLMQTVTGAYFKFNNKNEGNLEINLANGQLLMEANSGSYLKFNENNNGTLQMSLSGADIKLTDKNNQTINGYIEATANGILSEIGEKIIHHAQIDSLQEGFDNSILYIYLIFDEGNDFIAKNKLFETDGFMFDVFYSQNITLQKQYSEVHMMLNAGTEFGIYGHQIISINSENFFACENGEIISYILKLNDNQSQGIYQLSLSNSSIEQKADSITANVVKKSSEDDPTAIEGFSWKLLSSGFTLTSKPIGATTSTDVFICDHNGLTLRPKTFDLVTDSFKINSTGDPYYLQVTHNNTNVLNITGGIDSIFQMQSLPMDPQFNQSVYYVISTWDNGANVRHGGFNEDRTKIAWVDSTGENPVVNYPKGSLIAVTTKNPYKYRSSELWYETIDGYFICCRGSTWEDGGAYVYLDVKNKEGSTGPQTGYNAPADPLYYNAYSGTWDISTTNEKMFIDIQQGKIEIGSNAMKGINCKDEDGLSVEFKTFDQGAKSLYLGISEHSPFAIGSLYIDWDGRIGSKKLKSDGITWQNQWYIQPNGGASFGWLWTSNINCNTLNSSSSINGSYIYGSTVAGYALQGTSLNGRVIDGMWANLDAVYNKLFG